jgi:hypothetical protein
LNRYQDIQQLKTNRGKRYYTTTRYPDIPLSDDDLYIITMRGDRLDNLAYQFYGDSTLWWVLQIANPNINKDSLYPNLGVQFRIPTDINAILDEYERINS